MELLHVKITCGGAEMKERKKIYCTRSTYKRIRISDFLLETIKMLQKIFVVRPPKLEHTMNTIKTLFLGKMPVGHVLSVQTIWVHPIPNFSYDGKKEKIMENSELN